MTAGSRALTTKTSTITTLNIALPNTILPNTLPNTALHNTTLPNIILPNTIRMAMHTVINSLPPDLNKQMIHDLLTIAIINIYRGTHKNLLMEKLCDNYLNIKIYAFVNEEGSINYILDIILEYANCGALWYRLLKETIIGLIVSSQN